MIKPARKNKASEGVCSSWLQLLHSQISSTTRPGHRAHTSPPSQMMEPYFQGSHQASCWHQGEPHSQQVLCTHNLHTRCASPLHCTSTAFQQTWLGNNGNATQQPGVYFCILPFISATLIGYLRNSPWVKFD